MNIQSQTLYAGNCITHFNS